MAAGSITDADVADLVQRCRNAAAALIRGDMRNYLGLFVHSDDYTLLPPYGGGPRHGFDASDQAIEDMSRFFAGGEAQVELVQSVGAGPSGSGPTATRPTRCSTPIASSQPKPITSGTATCPATGTVPARTSRRPTSGCQPAANARWLAAPCTSVVRCVEIGLSARRTARCTGRRRTIMTPQDRTLCRSQLSGWLSSDGPYR